MSKLSQITINSPLSQSVTREGKTVQVKIYENGEGRWLLEVVDEYGNSTVWDTSFESDQDALDEAFNTINEEGIDSLIGAPSDAIAAMTLNCPLSKAEWRVLDDFLGDEEIEQTSMDVSTLDGFLTAIAIGPQIVPPSEWLSWVWDMEAGEAAPVFEDERQANRIMSLISRHYNSVLDTFNIDSESFTPIFWQDVSWGAAEWCEGFLLGFQFNEQDWSMLSIVQPAWMAPFLRLGTEDGIAITERANDADKWKNEIAPSITKIYEYWKSKHGNQPLVKFGGAFDFHAQKEGVTIVRGGPKIGRNDPCPCGSGKKFKKCCSVDATQPSLH